MILVMRISIWRLNARLAIQPKGSKKMNERITSNECDKNLVMRVQSQLYINFLNSIHDKNNQDQSGYRHCRT